MLYCGFRIHSILTNNASKYNIAASIINPWSFMKAKKIHETVYSLWMCNALLTALIIQSI